MGNGSDLIIKLFKNVTNHQKLMYLQQWPDLDMVYIAYGIFSTNHTMCYIEVTMTQSQRTVANFHQPYHKKITQTYIKWNDVPQTECGYIFLSMYVQMKMVIFHTCIRFLSSWI